MKVRTPVLQMTADHDHEIREFSILREAKRGGTAILDFQRSDFVLFGHLLERIPWQTVLKGIGVQEDWALFKQEVLMAQEQAVPRCCKRSQQQRRPPWLNRELWLELREKRRVYGLWKKGLVPHNDYKDAVRLCRVEIRRSKAQLEMNLASAIKDNKKCFYKYVNSKRPGRDSIPC